MPNDTKLRYGQKTPDQRKVPPPVDTITREEAWQVVLDNRESVFRNVQFFMQKAMGRRVHFVGRPFAAGSRWVVQGQYYGRPASDAMDELSSAALEAAMRAVELYDPTRTNSKGEQASMTSYIQIAVIRYLQREIDRWRATMGSEHEVSLDTFDSHPDRLTERTPDSEVRTLRNPREIVEDETAEEAMKAQQAAVVRAALSDREFRALTMKSDGMTLSEIGRELGLTKAGAQHVYERAIQIARRVLS